MKRKKLFEHYKENRECYMSEERARAAIAARGDLHLHHSAKSGTGYVPIEMSYLLPYKGIYGEGVVLHVHFYERGYGNGLRHCNTVEYWVKER